MNWKKTSHTPRMDGKQAKAGYPPFAEFCKFMRKEARIACNPVTSLQALKAEEAKDKVEPGRSKFNSRDKGDFRVRTFATKSEEKSGNAMADSSSKKIFCAFCKNNHELDLCEKFSQIALSERKKFVQANALFRGCLKWGHVYKECRGRKTCRRLIYKKTSPIHHLRTTNTVTVPRFNTYFMKNSIAFRSSIVWNLLNPDLAKTSNVKSYTRMASKSDNYIT